MTCSIDKISASVIENVFKQEGQFNIYISHLSIRKLHVLAILAKYQANIRH